HAARQALLDSDPDAAARVIDAAAGGAGDELIWTDPLAPCGALSIRIADAAEAVSGYARHVDFDSGAASLRWRAAEDQALIDVGAPRGSQRIVATVQAPPGRAVTMVLVPAAVDECPTNHVGARPPAQIQVRTSRETPTRGVLE